MLGPLLVLGLVAGGYYLLTKKDDQPASGGDPRIPQANTLLMQRMLAGWVMTQNFSDGTALANALAAENGVWGTASVEAFKRFQKYAADNQLAPPQPSGTGYTYPSDVDVMNALAKWGAANGIK